MEEENFWTEFLSNTLDLAGANLQYLLKRKQQELSTILEQSMIGAIVDRAIRFYRADLRYDNS